VKARCEVNSLRGRIVTRREITGVARLVIEPMNAEHLSILWDPCRLEDKKHNEQKSSLSSTDTFYLQSILHRA